MKLTVETNLERITAKCCESSVEERGAGKPHATFCGNRGWVTAPGDPVRSQQCDLLTRHIAMRLQHAEKTASTLPADTPERENARAVIVAEVLQLADLER